MQLKTNCQSSIARHHESTHPAVLSTYPTGFCIFRGREMHVQGFAWPPVAVQNCLILLEIPEKAAAFRPHIHSKSGVFLHRPKPNQILYLSLVRQALLIPMLTRWMRAMTLEMQPL